MKVVIVMPVFNAMQTLEKTYLGLPESLRQHVIIGDNQSTDGTFELATRLGLDVMRHDKNYGYGGNLKRLFRHALNHGADIVVELHGDYQYEPGLVDILVAYIARGYFDVMQGNRMRSRDEALAGGMHWYRYLGNRLLTMFENMWFGMNLGEWHCGLRAFRAEALAQVPFQTYPDTHAFANDLLMDCVMKGFRVAEIPVPVRYNKESSSVPILGLLDCSWKEIWATFKRPPWLHKPYGSAALPPLRMTEEEQRQTVLALNPAD
ncbi:MAG: glycosyltransferase family 2 protein [Candidatus Omnitrophica bacterium]|nr:glycosyltransferase family 2 protein [Candidatus Omnitrophota bacterium]